MRAIILFFSFFAATGILNAQDILINELMSSNANVIFDEDNDSPDWIELNNFGTDPVDLGNYFLSDDRDDFQKFQLPSVMLSPDDQFLVFASDKDRDQLPVNWHTIIDIGDEWKYILPNQEVSSDWNTIAFNDNSWNTGESGFGYGDGDDNTVIPNGTISVFMRSEFNIVNVDELGAMWLHMDYDDAFVAYLNGVEIARANIGTPGTDVAYDDVADIDHEAGIYNGGAPDAFDVSAFIDLIQPGENVLAIQSHNVWTGSSDFTAIPFLTLGFTSDVGVQDPLSPYVSLGSFYPHTNFKLSSSGEAVYLSHLTGGIMDSIAFGTIPVGYSYGRDFAEPAEIVYFEMPTPNAPNGGVTYSEVVQSEVIFSIPNTFLSTPQSLGLSGAEAGEEIRYTTNGEEPGLNSAVFQQPFLIFENTVVRARIFKEGAIPGKMNSKTYLFENPHDLPVITLTTDPDNLWDVNTGIYVLGNDYEFQFPYFGANFWEDWERPAHITLTEPTGETAFSKNCGIKIFGGWSRGNDQKSLSIFFRNEYGDGAVEYQLFEDKPIDEFSSLVLRNSGNDWNRSMMRDGMMTSLVRDLDIDRSAYRPAVLYINGEYWGIHNIREKINEDFLEANQGVDADSVNILETNAFVVEGSNEEYLELINFIESNNISLDYYYQQVAEKIDVSNFIDYQVSQIYFDNTDWPGNNIKFWKPQTQDSKWRWILFDTDFGFSIWGDNYTNNTLAFALQANGPGWPNPPWSTLMLRKLIGNTGFRHAFINRFADLLNTTFQPAPVIQHVENLSNVIESEMPRHFNRWSGASVWNWNQEITKMKNFGSWRVTYVRNHIKNQFSLPDQHTVDLETFPANGGSIDLNSLTIVDTPWEGVYFETVPISLTANANPGFVFSRWEVNGVVSNSETITLDLGQNSEIELFFNVDNNYVPNIVINEINYNAHQGNDSGDWVELFNPANEPRDVSEWIFKDSDDAHAFIIPEGTVIEPMGYLVLVKEEDDFTLIHPDVQNYIGEFDFGLSSSGDATRLFDESGVLIDSVFYGVHTPWPTAPNGEGPSLELIHYNLDNTLPESWKASLEGLGTPGEENSVITSIINPAFDTEIKLLDISPNPFYDLTTIRWNGNINELSLIQFFTTDNKLVFSSEVYGSSFNWNGLNGTGNRLPEGIYFCKVRTSDGFYSGKILLMK